MSYNNIKTEMSYIKVFYYFYIGTNYENLLQANEVQFKMIIKNYRAIHFLKLLSFVIVYIARFINQ